MASSCSNQQSNNHLNRLSNNSLESHNRMGHHQHQQQQQLLLQIPQHSTSNRRWSVYPCDTCSSEYDNDVDAEDNHTDDMSSSTAASGESRESRYDCGSSSPSGSGTDCTTDEGAGYEGSASSNQTSGGEEQVVAGASYHHPPNRQPHESWSPLPHKRRSKGRDHHTSRNGRVATGRQGEGHNRVNPLSPASSASSSEIDDFGSGSSSESMIPTFQDNQLNSSSSNNNSYNNGNYKLSNKASHRPVHMVSRKVHRPSSTSTSSSPSELSSCSSTNDGETKRTSKVAHCSLKESYLSAKRQADAGHAKEQQLLLEETMMMRKRKLNQPRYSSSEQQQQQQQQFSPNASRSDEDQHQRENDLLCSTKKRHYNTTYTTMTQQHHQQQQQQLQQFHSNAGRSPSSILTIGSDIMANIFTYLGPTEILDVLTMPLSKDWRQNYTVQPELWRVLCLVEPFKAKLAPDTEESATTIGDDDDYDDDGIGSSDSTGEEFFYSLHHFGGNSTDKRLLRKFRGLYTTFVRCFKYISQIRNDAINNRSLASIDYSHNSGGGGGRGSSTTEAIDVDEEAANASTSSSSSSSISRSTSSPSYVHNNSTMDIATSNKDQVGHVTESSSSSPTILPALAGENKNLQNFLAQARDLALIHSKNQHHSTTSGTTTSDDSEQNEQRGTFLANNNNDQGGNNTRETTIVHMNSVAQVATMARKRRRNTKHRNSEGKNYTKFGPSVLTTRLLGPSKTGEPGNLSLPWSCVIYSIVNWMVAFSDVEGIQVMCLKVLPFLLEDERQRQVAQTAGLIDIILRDMITFSDSEQVHTAAFHAIVLLARPHGGREGMLFHGSMASNGIFGEGRKEHGLSGIAVMLDSMRRFEDNVVLMAMSCWALVNIALSAEPKAATVKLGGIKAVTNAMQKHPFSAEVQFRALFALINLVIPSVQGAETTNTTSISSEQPSLPRRAVSTINDELDVVRDVSEREILDEMVGDIATLVVWSMKNFCSSEAILNRACLVLHNLSLTDDYHATLLYTPQCYQMLEWCVANYPSDQVLQRSACGTLHRLQVTLSTRNDLQKDFAESVRRQHGVSLQQAHREAQRLHEQQQESPCHPAIL